MCANVKDPQTLLRMANEMRERESQARQQSQETLGKLGSLLDQTKIEAGISKGLLVEAQARLATADAQLAAASAALAQAMAEQAAAISSGNPIAIAAAAANVAAAMQREAEAARVRNEAKRHFDAMQRRNELAQECLGQAEALLQQTQETFSQSLAVLSGAYETGRCRLIIACGDLTGYLMVRPTSAQREILQEWRGWQPEARQPVRPDVLEKRLQSSPELQQALLCELYEKDPAFRESIDRLRQKVAQGEFSLNEAISQVRKNTSGRLAEEIVKTALAPLGTETITQGVIYFEDGRYTKTDLIVQNLVVPVILGRGSNMAAREGGSLAVEVKSGQGNYLKAQKDHMVFQAGGHQASTASCTICTRNIKDLAPGEEEALRAALREAGSPLIGMLPSKESLDKVCIHFVLGGFGDVS